MTKGEYRVGVSFNPSGDDMVHAIKTVAATFIDLIDSIPAKPSLEPDIDATNCLERMRLKEMAMASIEEAAMWGVKAATKPNRKEA